MRGFLKPTVCIRYTTRQSSQETLPPSRSRPSWASVLNRDMGATLAKMRLTGFPARRSIGTVPSLRADSTATTRESAAARRPTAVRETEFR